MTRGSLGVVAGAAGTAAVDRHLRYAYGSYPDHHESRVAPCGDIQRETPWSQLEPSALSDC
jgi:hypothetical protein